MQSNVKSAQRYFERVPNEWDALYSHENRLKYALNRWLRRWLFVRYDFTFQKCGDLTGAHVLDIGCGTGRFSVECAKRGAAKVVGVDFASPMIAYATRIAEEMGVSDRCQFICDDFLSHEFSEHFDVVLAMGLFDYVKEPEPVFNKVASLSPRKFIASFPRFTLVWGIQRHIRYNWIRKCPIYYYTKVQVERLYREALFVKLDMIEARTAFAAVGERL